MIRALIPLADGCEEMEVVIAADVLRRAGWEVVLAGLHGREAVTASRRIRLLPDARWEDLDLLSFDLLILPGGAAGSQALCSHDGVQETIRIFDIEEKWVAAICGGPLALHQAGILDGRAFTCYPGVEKEMSRTDRSGEPVVADRNLITSQGPGTAFDFALKLIELIDAPSAAEKIRSGLIYKT
ncbi:MAG: DJ-1/PfpI family protein [Pontiellaceae bacterium]|jgi:4-methyl-5(b-hydroxyethyl)-thiazole monophosphate biosynthesis|nr:DJ-1/PfpI family protein [Pontiellaceae bacterium]